MDESEVTQSQEQSAVMSVTIVLSNITHVGVNAVNTQIPRNLRHTILRPVDSGQWSVISQQVTCSSVPKNPHEPWEAVQK
jgi:hypothetical protein